MNMGEQETLITVALPEATRANSAQSGLDHVDLSGDYTLRYIFQVFDENGNNGTEQQVVYTDEKAATFRVQLVGGRKYKFVAWTDIVEGEEALHYNVDKNMNVTMTGDWGVMDETRDAFTCSEVHEFNGNMPVLNLKRPFAKIRVVTDDIAKLMGAGLENGMVTYTTQVNTSFNALTQTAGTPANREVEFTYGKDNVYFHKYVEKEYQRTLYADYLFVTENDVVSFILQNNLAKNEFTTDIPVARNQVTTIFGSLLTNGSDIRVEVKDEFVSETIYLEGDVTLTEDLVIDRPMVVRDDATAVLNLNGHKIINTTGTADYESEGIIVYGNLTINDETGKGLIEANSRAIWARGNYGATITINGGNYVGAHLNTEVIYASGNGQIEINGGTFEALTTSSGHGSGSNLGKEVIILNLHNNGAAGCSIVVKGGSFKNFNPEDNVAENPKHNFCAPGYISVAKGEWFDVVEGVKITSKDDLLNVLNNTTTTNIFFDADINMGTSNISANRDLNIDMQGYKYYSYSGSGVGNYAFYTNTKNITIDNANMEGDGFNVRSGSLTFNGGDFKLKASKNGRNGFYVAAYPTEETAILTINGGNFDIDRVHQDRVHYISAQGNAIVYIKGGNFGAPGEAGYKPIATSGVQGVDGQVIITGGTFGFDPSDWVADGYQAVQNGTTWTVSKE